MIRAWSLSLFKSLLFRAISFLIWLIALTSIQSFEKRVFDFFFSLLLLIIFSPLIVIAWLLATVETGQNGLFVQQRVGQYGFLFSIYKIRTMKSVPKNNTTITVLGDTRITSMGRSFRFFKIDELPQLFNVLLGHMSFVGPRPDVPGFADLLSGSDRILLTLKPGITGPATLKYRNEEYLLSLQSDPVSYNKNVIWPDKVQVNLHYLKNWSLIQDISIIFQTLSLR